MRRLKISIILTFTLVIASSACDGGKPNCIPPSEPLSKIDIVGTWVAGIPGASDTLVIKSDGTYRQIVSNGETKYSSDWHNWRIEIDTKIPHLYFEGMSLCGFNSDIPCNQVGGGGYDYCEDSSIQNDEGVILLVLEDEEKSFMNSTNDLTSYVIYLLYPSLDQGWYYYLQKP